MGLPPRPIRRQTLVLEPLEGRRLLYTSTSSSLYYREQQVQHKYHQYVSELQHLELKSQATPAQYLALRNDARAISQAASTTTLSPQAAQQKATLAALQLDRAPLDGSLSDQQWAGQTTELTNTLDGFNAPSSLIDQTIADMKAIAQSAGVSLSDYNSLAQKADSFERGRDALPSYATHYPDPTLYYTQHLRGFFRGGAVQRSRDEATLKAALHAAGATAALRRDVNDLEQVGGALTTQENEQLGADLVAAFAHGPATDQALAQLGDEFQALLSSAGSPSASAAADRLLADANGFFQAAGSSPAQFQTIVSDVQAVVADGVGSPLNPFKIQVNPS